MKLLSLSLRGATGIYNGLGLDEIHIGFDEIEPGVVAFVAPNGHGKTTLLENLHPFRKLVSRTGKLADHFYLRDSHRVLEWEQGGHVYLAKLLLDGVKGASESYLYCDGEPLNDGKNTTYDAAIAEVVGDEGLFFSSLFRAQNADSITDMTAGERKKLLSALLGFDRYEAFRAIADDHRPVAEACARETETEIAVVRERVSAREAVVAEIAEHEARITQLRSDLDTVPERDIETIQSEIATTKARIAALDARAVELADAIERHDGTNPEEMLNQAIALTNEHRALVAKRERLEKIVANEAAIKAGLAKIEELRGHVDTERARQAAHVVAKEQRRELENQHRERIERAASDARECGSKSHAALKAAQDIKDEYQREKKRHQEFVERIEAATERLEQVPCHGMDIQSGCPLMRDAVELASSRDAEEARWNEWVHAWQERANAANEAATEAGKAHVEADESLECARAERDRAMNEFDVMNDAELSWTPFEISRLTEALKIEESKRWPDLAIECAGAVAAMAELDEAITRAEDAYQAKLDEHVAALNAWSAESMRLKTEHVATTQAKSELVRHLAVLDTRYADAKHDIARRQFIETEIATVTGSLKSATSRLESMENCESEIANLESQLACIRADIYEWTMLSRACSPRGIPALELDAAGPKISDIANSLLASTFGSEFRIEFETTRLTATGDQTEAFEIMVYSGDEARKIELLSGGQRVWIEAAISQAIALYIREQSGLDLRTSFLDEADGALDSDNAFRYLEMLRASHNRSGAHHTIVITHRQELLSLIPSQLHLVRGEGVIAC